VAIALAQPPYGSPATRLAVYLHPAAHVRHLGRDEPGNTVLHWPRSMALRARQVPLTAFHIAKQGGVAVGTDQIIKSRRHLAIPPTLCRIFHLLGFGMKNNWWPTSRWYGAGLYLAGRRERHSTQAPADVAHRPAQMNGVSDKKPGNQRGFPSPMHFSKFHQRQAG